MIRWRDTWDAARAEARDGKRGLYLFLYSPT